MDLQALRCKSCGAPLDPENVVERLAMARCVHCGSVFSIAQAKAAGEARALRPKVAMPRGIEVADLGTTLEIRRRWFTAAALFLAFFCIFWNGFMIVWHGMALSMGAWLMSLFGLLHTAVGIGLLYFTLACFLNTTIVRVGHGLIEVRTGPLPWLGNKTINAHDVKQCYCRERIRHGKNGTHCSYEVHVVCKNDVREPLLKGLSDADQALYVEQELERHLRIKDQPVRGELSG